MNVAYMVLEKFRNRTGGTRSWKCRYEYGRQTKHSQTEWGDMRNMRVMTIVNEITDVCTRSETSGILLRNFAKLSVARLSN